MLHLEKEKMSPRLGKNTYLKKIKEYQNSQRTSKTRHNNLTQEIIMRKSFIVKQVTNQTIKIMHSIILIFNLQLQ